MTGTREPDRRPRGHAVASAVVAAVTVALVAVAVANLADQHWLTGIVALLIAAGFTVTLLVIRALMLLNRALADQNAVLRYAVKHPEGVSGERSA